MNLPAFPKVDVAIIGGGVVGVAAGYELAQKKASVAIIEKGEIGFGCSYGNAGWLTPCFAMPLPMPGMLSTSIKWLFDPESPLYIKPDLLNPLLLKWLVSFMKAMNRNQMRRSVQALTEISKYSLEAYARLNQSYPDAFGFRKNGLLMISNTKAGVKAAHEEMMLVAEYGIPGKSLDPNEIVQLEPAIRGNVMGGVYFPQEAHAEPLKVVQTLARNVSEKGGYLYPHTELLDFMIDSDGKIQGLKTTRGMVQANTYVLATGSWSTRIGKQLKLNIPIMGGKGYSLILPPLPTMPKVPIMIVERKIAVTPRSGSIRLAGTLELVDQDFSVTQRRVDAIVRGSRQFLDIPERPQVQEVWRGLRPCTPDGVPLIGRPKRYKNLFLCTGHQMLGLQSAAGSGRLLADLVTGSPPTFNPAPFDADRF